MLWLIYYLIFLLQFKKNMFKIILGLLEYDNIKTGIGTQKKKK